MPRQLSRRETAIQNRTFKTQLQNSSLSLLQRPTSSKNFRQIGWWSTLQWSQGPSPVSSPVSRTSPDTRPRGSQPSPTPTGLIQQWGAASLAAKVTRDAFMLFLRKKFGDFGWVIPGRRRPPVSLRSGSKAMGSSRPSTGPAGGQCGIFWTPSSSTRGIGPSDFIPLAEATGRDGPGFLGPFLLLEIEVPPADCSIPIYRSPNLSVKAQHYLMVTNVPFTDKFLYFIYLN